MKKILFLVIIALILMIGCPFLAVNVAGDGGMALCFILFFAVDPLFSAACGLYCGGRMKERWALLLLSPFLFLAGTWLFFDFGELAFLLYAGGYLLIGAVAMTVRHFAKKYNGKEG